MNTPETAPYHAIPNTSSLEDHKNPDLIKKRLTEIENEIRRLDLKVKEEMQITEKDRYDVPSYPTLNNLMTQFIDLMNDLEGIEQQNS